MPPPAREHSPVVARAQELFRGWAAHEHPQVSPGGLIALGKSLVQEQEFGYARRVLEHVTTDDPGERLQLAQQRALATYKDHDLRAAGALEAALELLGDLTAYSDAETLGLAGAVYKRLWEVTGQRRHLDLALACYRRGYDDRGGEHAYPGINAAFVSDVLAEEDAEDTRLVDAPQTRAQERRAEAERIRREIVTALAPVAAGSPGWWDAATLVEANLGLGDYQEARQWAAKAPAAGVAPWQLESTARQLTALALLRLAPDEDFAASEAGCVVGELFDAAPGALPSLAVGRRRPDVS